MEPAVVKGPLQLAWQYVAHYRVRTLLLILALGLTLALPLAVRGLVQIAQAEMRSRAAATPLVLGAKGSPLELVLNALYFRRRGAGEIPQKQVQAIRSSGLATAIPLYVRYHAQQAPIVGTSLEYFAYRGLPIAQGRTLGRLGDCVVGARVARERGWQVGGKVSSSPEQVFDLAGIYPLRMTVTGVLAESGTADDHAIFVDVKTAWLIEGKAHGHEDLVTAEDPNAVLSRTDQNVVGSKAVRMYNEVTAENLKSFHFHGNPDDFPLTAILVVPKDEKAQAILLGRYQKPEMAHQLVQPVVEMDALLATLVQAERFTVVLLGVLGVVVILISSLVFALSFKMRRREFATLEDLGISRWRIATVKAAEVVMVGVLAAGLAGGITALVWELGAGLVRMSLN
ncbi:ABC transporter permease [Verrucomicrobium sp. BvORR034]|uniref:ABC transporter permease n=1 Tax=Verrucomicrobium sp. BvORR034 TaxID=1396418 RepID=UPI000678FFDF|nr:ABC transporter permease [Verrucomicrobium sp. BvORR034]